ncbi:hypothetical protein DXH95_04975 [Sphingorhabdus pulchriflava]|uniref:Uncharacterized protein n=1 Tax=Sphingorhabdus pulchriflava TaxID=2292257 RepID=A0A371BGS3_9SPHN|nr:hypothetical protein [Sphingorhabdus pulchriflava]RDV06760.1 hypothetical protein DXH95_04975 [Sphingorhabdus pulchriflava]
MTNSNLIFAAAMLAILNSNTTVHSTQPVQQSDRDKIDAETVVLFNENSLAINVGVDGTYSGPGWDRLIGEGEKAGIVILGEQHATADIPALANQLHATLKSDALAIEVGPWSARYATELIKQGAGKLEAWQARSGHGFAFPFLFFAEESKAAEKMALRSPEKIEPLWGLDQEFVGSGASLPPMLQREAKTNAQKAAVASFAAVQRKDPMMVGSIDDPAIDALAGAFAGNAIVGEIVTALRMTSAIYAPYTRGIGSFYEANLKREDYMKSNFVAAYNRTKSNLGRNPRVLVKLGGNHAMRGINDTNLPAFGNFAAEWGHAQEIGVVNIMADCFSGQARSPQSNKAEPCEAMATNAPALKAIEKKGPVTLVDFRPMRAKLGKLKNIDSRSRELILAFDFYLAIADVRPATMIQFN